MADKVRINKSGGSAAVPLPPLTRAFSLYGIIVGTAAMLYYLAAGMYGGFNTSVLWVWPAAGSVLILLAAADRITARRGGWVRIPILLLRYLICACAAAFFAVQAALVPAMNDRAPAGADTLLVLGAQVNGEEPGAALRSRIDQAYAYLRENPDTRAVLCGGRGTGEDITEAECMRRALTERGISGDRLILEERSASTSENIRFAWELAGDPDETVAVVSNNFHLFRSMRLARACGWKTVYGEAAPFRSLLLVHYMAREFLTITVDTLRGNMD